MIYEMGRQVSTDGDPNSTIMLIGEAPGRDEDIQGKPFVGASGYLLWRMMDSVGLERKDCYITNVVNRRPPGNDLSAMPERVLQSHIVRLHQEIDAAKANVLVPIGGVALRAITNKDSIRDWRGSVFDTIIHGRLRKVLPVVHPAAIMREWSPWEITTRFDLAKVKEESGFSHVCRIPRRSITPTSQAEVYRALASLQEEAAQAGWMALDIECDRKNQELHCVGFAANPSQGYSFGTHPWFFADGESGCEASIIAIKELISGSVPLVTQNGNFDMLVLKHWGYPVRMESWQFDTEYAHHLLHIELPKSLAYLTSLYTDQPYYKGMLDEAVTKKTMNWELLSRYNALDCMVTIEIAQRLRSDLAAIGQINFFQEHYMELNRGPLMEAQTEGVLIDHNKREEVGKQLCKERIELYQEVLNQVPKGWLPAIQRKTYEKICSTIKELARSKKAWKKDGKLSIRYLNWVAKRRSFVPEVNLSSPSQVQELLYDVLKAPVVRVNGSVSTDEEALTKTLRNKKAPGPAKTVAGLMLKYRSVDKLITTYINCAFDKDGRDRCQYNVATTKTGRLSSSSTPMGTGKNLQNIPKRKGLGGAIRRMYLPDEGDVFIAADYGQAEARVVGFDANEAIWMEAFDNGDDLFKTIAGRLFRVPPSEVTKTQRSVTKVIVHGKNYGMGVDLLAFNLGWSKEEACLFVERYDKEFYHLGNWRMSTRDFVDKHRYLCNLLGRKRVFYDRIKSITKATDGELITHWNQALLRDMWSWKPQSTVGDLLNLALLRLWKTVQQRQDWLVHKPRFRLQVHDEMIWSIAVKDVEQMVALIQEAMAISLETNGRSFLIPCSISTGTTWGDMKEIA